MVIRPLSSADRRAHLRLLRYLVEQLPTPQRCVATRWMATAWPWKYGSSGDGARGPCAWLAIAGRRPVGSFAALPVDLQLGERGRHGWWLVDLVVHPAARGTLLGVAHRLMAEAHSLPGVKLALGVHPVARRLYVRRFGWRERGGIDWWGCRLDRRLAQPAIPAALGRLRAVPVAQFPQTVDLVAQRVACGYQAMIRRDARWLNWRYEAPVPRTPYRKFLIQAGDQLVGLLVLRVSARDARRGAIKELLVERADHEALRFGLQHAKAAFQAWGVRDIQLLHLEGDRVRDRVLWEEGFVPQFAPPGFFYAPLRGSASQVLANGSLYLSSGDADLHLLFE